MADQQQKQGTQAAAVAVAAAPQAPQPDSNDSAARATRAAQAHTQAQALQQALPEAGPAALGVNAEVDGLKAAAEKSKAKTDANGKKTKPIVWDVNEKLSQTDDDIEAREQAKGAPLNAEKIKELKRTNQDWLEHFDPLAGFEADGSEKDTITNPNKFYKLQPVPKGRGKERTVKTVNGVKQYAPKMHYGSFPYHFDQAAVGKSMSGLFYEAASKYVFETLLKEYMNKQLNNEHYGRKMPAMPLDRPFPVSFAAVEEITGVSFDAFMKETLRKGWFKAGSALTGFDISTICETDEQRQGILKITGDAIIGWKPADYPGVLITVQVFKRVGKIVLDGFKYKGRPPQSSQLRAVAAAIGMKSEKYADYINQYDITAQKIEAGSVPAEALTAANTKDYEGCKTQLKWWALVNCGLEGMADERERVEQDALAKKAAPTDVSAMAEGFDFLEL